VFACVLEVEEMPMVEELTIDNDASPRISPKAAGGEPIRPRFWSNNIVPACANPSMNIKSLNLALPITNNELEMHAEPRTIDMLPA
jgi:hypothetical protein